MIALRPAGDDAQNGRRLLSGPAAIIVVCSTGPELTSRAKVLPGGTPDPILRGDLLIE
jgi:hypothetical protein